MKHESRDDNRTETKRCRVCGCDDLQACVDEETGEACYWAEDDLCSRCAKAMDDYDAEDLAADVMLYATSGLAGKVCRVFKIPGEQAAQTLETLNNEKEQAQEVAKDLIDVIRDGMAENAGNAAICYLGELLTDWTLHNPGKAAKADTKGKTLKGAMDAMRSEAQKKSSGSIAVLSDAEGVKIALAYFGLSQEAQAPADPLDLDALLGM